MKLKSQLMKNEEVVRALKRMSHQIAERNEGCQNVVLLGIKSGGVPIANMLAANIKVIENVDVPVGVIDITHYRDDLSEIAKTPVTGESIVPFDITDKNVVLVDDVFYTGRTARAALDAISKMGRAKTIQLAVLIDRGHRELPIRADYVGKNVPTSRNESVIVRIDDLDGGTCVCLYEK